MLELNHYINQFKNSPVGIFYKKNNPDKYKFALCFVEHKYLQDAHKVKPIEKNSYLLDGKFLYITDSYGYYHPVHIYRQEKLVAFLQQHKEELPGNGKIIVPDAEFREIDTELFNCMRHYEAGSRYILIYTHEEMGSIWCILENMAYLKPEAC